MNITMVAFGILIISFMVMLVSLAAVKILQELEIASKTPETVVASIFLASVIVAILCMCTVITNVAISIIRSGLEGR